MDNNTLICLGKIVDAHGLKGQVKIKSFTEIPEGIEDYSPLTDKNGKVYNITIKSATTELLIADVEGIKDRTEAEKLKGTELYTTSDKLPEIENEDEFYLKDLINLKVLDVNRKEIGHISAVHNYGNVDILEIQMKGGKKELLDFTKESVPEISIKEQFIVITPPEIEFAEFEKDEE